ncbi:hypothetical protein [Vallitalea guaymasensis]|uniref:hypothetical protein n=1 Tax=Vallitalea guaymasensis TaxID=1185412 RepID=UPI000DE501A6|nr:hypothetical protein [Vallitalea guaymasensis]
MDWDIKSRNSIDSTLRNLYNEINKLEDEIFRLGDFINSSGQAYSQAEDSISKLVGLDNLTINSSISSNKNSNSPKGNNPFKGFDFSSSIKHLLDFFRRIGQATIDFFVLDDPRNALKTADSFIDIKPCAGIAYWAGLPSYKNILIDTDFNIVANDPLINKYDAKYTTVDKTNDFESVFSNMWNNIWSHIKKIGEFFAPVYENIKDLSIKHQEAMKKLPNDIAMLDYEPWMSTLKTFSDPEDKYRCAISNIPSYKEAGHAMVLGWMATDPSSRGINPKYYPQLLATLMVYKDKGALTLEQIDAKYLEIYNRNEEAIRRAEEKEKEENSSVLDTAMEWTHTVLDIVGWVPFCGDVCDLINAGLYLLQNDFLNVALSCIAFIPAIGQGIKGLLKKIFNAGDDAKAIAKILSKIDNPKAIIEKIKVACTHMISWLKNLPNSIDNLLDSPFISKMLGGAKKGVSKIIDGISSMLDKFTTKIQGTIDDIVKKIEKKFFKKSQLDDILIDLVDDSGKIVADKFDDVISKIDAGDFTEDELKKLVTETKDKLTNNQKGILGEAFSDITHKNKYPDYAKLDCKLPKNNGFDGVYVKYNKNGGLESVHIVEAKYGTSQLGTIKGVDGTGNIKQMSNKWINDVIERMANSGDSKLMDIADTLQDVMEDSPELITKYLDRISKETGDLSTKIID